MHYRFLRIECPQCELFAYRAGNPRTGEDRDEGEMNSGATHHDDGAPKARHPSTGPGMTVPRLTFAEQLVLWSARRLSAAGLGGAATETEASACRKDVLARVEGELGVALCPTGGPTAGSEAAEALERTLDIFGCAGVRSLRLNPMCCRFVSNDERLFMSFLAGCQEGDCQHTAALLSWFLPPAAVRTAATDGASFAAALLGAGFRLPQRLHLAASAGYPQAAPVGHAAPPTLH